MSDTAGAFPRHFPSSAALRDFVFERGSRVLLSFSCGKDAIASWVALRDRGFEILPFYFYVVPGLDFVEESLRYYENRFGVRIHRFPSPSLYRQLRNLVFQPPETCAAIESSNLPSGKARDFNIEHDIRRSLATSDTFVATGVRAADSPARYAALKHHGVLNWKTRKFFPVYDWKMDDVVRSITDNGLRLPVDYQLFNRTLDGIDYRFLKPIRDRFPRDYARILEWFPLAELDLFRRGEL
jgi:3'-phosphoadenosine 5'-phosphosulfate sulfotransferase (PAPS reductase)/FAD synthetase